MGEAGKNGRGSEVANKQSAPPGQRKRKPKRAPDPVIHRSQITEPEIDDTVEDSFPASDPPSWNSGVDRQPAPPKTG
jgi:hypothetical protein